MLPARPKVTIPTGENVEEVSLMEFDPRDQRGRGAREAYNEDSDDEGMGGPRVQCAHQ